ncbi:cupredoxin domain-containing protein [Arcticibacterium luteifluviistationis]|uniref:EfeO-type cupredoxin-like domain-containing protein n=1 Tax=Arcticibacterium luteifluviistationis TaxID=1784714 RepID=A0A2Z4GB11_9BACT|nr:cupredoxin domain-containing protein [Arcticibacterium luteifluviistationis]AWV98268.1 hypothetical protein DJ013_08835 [Arcticibacterium luteifluviistationis]
MKNLLAALVATFALTFSTTTYAQSDAKVVTLEQTEGAFTQKSLTLEPGTYVFKVANNGVNHDLGFVLTPKGKSDEAHHIKEAYVTELIKEGTSSTSKVVTLKKGEYEYFCPLNPTPKYTLVVK